VSEDPDVLLRKIGRRILRRRQELGMTQHQLADRLSMASTNIGRIEHGEQNLTIRTLAKLADALGLPVMELLGSALAGLTLDETDGPLPNVLSSIALEARALATLAKSSPDESVKALAPSLDKLYQRIAALAEVTLRK
jgi:transcriptional regulator with XRE-family HTH domain